MSSNLKRGSSSFGDAACAGQWSEGGDVKQEPSSISAKPTSLFGGSNAPRSTASSSSNQDPKTSSSNDTSGSSYPAAKKSKLAPATLKNPFEVLCSGGDDSTSNADGVNKGASSFLKPSKLDWGANSMFKTVQSNSIPPASKPQTNSFSSQFLSMTRAPSCGILNPIPGGELNGSSSYGDSKNLTCPPTASTKVEESAPTSEEAPASNTSTGEGNSKKVTSEATPLFGSLKSTATASSSSNANETPNCSSDAGFGSKLFMFGQNLQDRVLVPTASDTKSESSSKAAEEGVSGADCAQNQSKKTVTGGESKPTPVFASGLSNEPFIFKDAVDKTDKKGDNLFSNTVQMQTGEENEITVLQIQARLFQYDSALKNWRERGRGLLKVNESKLEGNGKASSTSTSNVNSSARILMRTHATYQLVLNTKLFADQLLEKASDKALKLSCFNEENTGMSLYTIKGSPVDIDCLFQQLKGRIDKLKLQTTSHDNEQSSDDDQTRQENKGREELPIVEEKKGEPQNNATSNFGTDDTSSGADSYYRSTTPSGHSLDENSRNTSPPLSSSEETNF